MRALWMVPIIMLWAVVMTLPMSTRAVLGATLGVLVIAQTGIMLAVKPTLGPLSLVTTAFAYGLSGYGLVLFAHWRERDNRELFLHRHEHQRLVVELRAQYEPFSSSSRSATNSSPVCCTICVRRSRPCCSARISCARGRPCRPPCGSRCSTTSRAPRNASMRLRIASSSSVRSNAPPRSPHSRPCCSAGGRARGRACAA